MKWIRMFSAAFALAGMMASTNAGLHGSGGCKSCGCAEECQPACCKPTIARPCHRNVYTYQRKCSDIKPPCCDSCCAPQACCAPAGCGNGNGNGNGCCAADPGCCAPVACHKGCGDNCAADPGCCAPVACHKGCGDNCAADPGCCAPVACHKGCGDNCGEACDCCNDDCCEIAKLIYTSMTDCYAKNRRKALDKLGRKYDCCCHPEIMNAFVYGLNDSDERVRREAADEIGDQIRRNRCCCSPCVVSALTCSLADCDRWVRREATQALRACGYEIVDGCCGGCCETGCCSTGCGSNSCGATPVSAPASAQPQPTPTAPEAVPAPAPPADPQAFFPSRLHSNQSKKSSLAGLFGMVR
jgi:hypothetical protein